MNVVDTRLPKLCHAPVGGVVQIDDDYFIVCAFNPGNKRSARPGMSQGLYDDERDLFLVNLRTGEAVKMPHLSSRVEIVRDASVVLGSVPVSATRLQEKA